MGLEAHTPLADTTGQDSACPPCPALALSKGDLRPHCPASAHTGGGGRRADAGRTGADGVT